MLLAPGIRPAYSRAERISDGVVHVTGVAAAVIAVPVLIVATVLIHPDVKLVYGTAIYGTTLLAMLTFSALYNMIDSARWSGLLQRLDHSGIYFKIAGTYTPFVLSVGAQPGALLAGLWGTAAVGSVIKFLDPKRFRWLALVLYLGMGWAIVFADRSMLDALPLPVVWLMIAGGLTYSLGVAFYLFERLPFHYTIWHVFVLAGSVLFFLAVTLKVLSDLG